VTLIVIYTKKQFLRQRLHATDAAVKDAEVTLKMSNNGFNHIYDEQQNTAISVLSSGKPILEGNTV
jgi:hypothetical protein